MTFLAPVFLPVRAPLLDEWPDFAKAHVSIYFDKFCKDKEFDGVCLMLAPMPDAIPFIAIEDEYDDADELAGLLRAATDNLVVPVPNLNGHVVVAWPFFAESRDHRARIHGLLREIAAATSAVGSAVVNECWLRTDLNAPSGTGEDTLMILSERAGHDTLASVAKIEGPKTARTLAPWRDLPGNLGGPLAAGILPRVGSPEARVNVGTVGEA